MHRPMRFVAVSAVVTLVAVSLVGARQTDSPDEKGVRLVRDDQRGRVEVFVDGKPFTAYVHPASLRKPVLYPVRTAGGNPVTRGFPLDPRPGERVDHPHQVGLWFNYGDVNGVDFWNNSDAIPAADRAKMGTVVHKAITATRDGADAGELDVEMQWVFADGKPVLDERTHFVFRGGEGWRSVDRVTRLTPVAGRVSMTDNKEGLLGLRVARALEMPSNQPDVFTDAAGRPTAVKTMDNTGVTGNYFTSEGKKGDAVWGTRGRWCALSGRLADEPVTVVILDHPSNPGFPTYWHARGYGLFAANPLGQKAFSEGREALNFAIEANENATFRHRVLILSEIASPDRIEAAYKEFAADRR